MGDLTPKALALGYRPAFKFVMAPLIDNASQPKHSFNAHSLAIQFTDQTGNAREILAWYKVNKINIHFDTAQKIFLAG